MVGPSIFVPIFLFQYFGPSILIPVLKSQFVSSGGWFAYIVEASDGWLAAAVEAAALTGAQVDCSALHSAVVNLIVRLAERQ